MTPDIQSQMESLSPETVKFLIVDDDQISVIAIKRALKRLKLDNPIWVASDGIEGLETLREPSIAAQLLPRVIIILDINMPRMNGIEFMQELRADPLLQKSVVFILTTSDAKSDIERAYGLNVAGYILKDNIGESLERAMGMIGQFSKTVALPH